MLMSGLYVIKMTCYFGKKTLQRHQFVSVMEKTSVSTYFWRNSFNKERVKVRLSSPKRTEYRLGSLWHTRSIAGLINWKAHWNAGYHGLVSIILTIRVCLEVHTKWELNWVQYTPWTRYRFGSWTKLTSYKAKKVSYSFIRIPSIANPWSLNQRVAQERSSGKTKSVWHRLQVRELCKWN